MPIIFAACVILNFCSLILEDILGFSCGSSGCRLLHSGLLRVLVLQLMCQWLLILVLGIYLAFQAGFDLTSELLSLGGNFQCCYLTTLFGFEDVVRGDSQRLASGGGG
jgi:hypothetical protein